VGFIVERTMHRALAALANKTDTDIDDKVVAILRRPLFLSAIFIGLYWATGELRAQLGEAARHVTYGVILTLTVVMWAGALMRIGTLVMGALSANAREGSLVQPSSLPLFDILMKVAVTVLGLYFVFLVWRLDLTGWLASAGIIGVAVGFGAKDTFANLFAGIFILADAPYRVGDFILLEDGLRGRVTGIGIRSTRILTLDNVEITVPNGLIGNSRIVNEAGGPDPKRRMQLEIPISYGSDIEIVRRLLLDCPKGVSQVCEEPAPEVHLKGFGNSGLNFVLLVWVHEPAMRDPVTDILYTRIYKALSGSRIEIPFNKHDVYIKQMVPAVISNS